MRVKGFIPGKNCGKSGDSHCAQLCSDWGKSDRLVSPKITGSLLRSGYCASIRPRVMLHERGLIGSHEFHEGTVSISVNGVSGMTHTPTDTNTHINHVCRWVGNVTAFPLPPTCVVSVCVWFGSLFVSRRVLSLPLSPSRFWAFSLAGIWSWRQFDALIRPWYVFSKATLHVRSACAVESAALLIHILCKIRSVWCGGMVRLEDEAHGQ